jgi:hypothetical protein
MTTFITEDREGAEKMNANDLADRLEQFYSGSHIQKAAEVLRQQQAEIEALKQANEEARKYSRYLSNLCAENDIQIIWYF